MLATQIGSGVRRAPVKESAFLCSPRPIFTIRSRPDRLAFFQLPLLTAGPRATNSPIPIERGLTLRNAFNKETFIFAGPPGDPTVARFDVRLEPGGSGGGNALVHIHPGADEHFTVEEGRIKVVISSNELIDFCALVAGAT